MQPIGRRERVECLRTFFLGEAPSMTSTLRTHAHVGVLSVLTATALVAALAAVPATAATVTTSVTSSVSTTTSLARPAGPSVRTVTLLTGDRVVLRTDATGRTAASITPDSPHYGRKVEYVNTGTHTWVVPKLAPSVRSRLDTSVFDVAALRGRV